MKRIICLIILFVSITINLVAQKTYTPKFSDPILDKFRWQHIKELSGKNFSCMLERNDGTIWFGIGGGVMSYDGYRWTKYMMPKEMENKFIRSMVFIGDTLYLGTDNGLLHFVNGDWINPKFKLKSENFVRSLRVDGKFLFFDFKAINGILLGASMYGLYMRKNGIDHYFTGQYLIDIMDTIPELSNIKFHPLEQLNSKSVFFTNILDNGDNTFFAFLTSKLGTHFKFRITENDEYPLQIIETKFKNAPLLGGPISSIKRPNNDIWVVSMAYSLGLNILKNNQWQYFSFKEHFNESNISSKILQLSDSSVLIASKGVVFRFQNGQWHKISTPDIPFKSSALKALFTSKGNLWMGDQKGEVYMIDYDNKHWSIYSDMDYQFTHKNGGRWFISKDNKVVYTHNNQWYYYDQSDGLIQFPQVLYQAKEGTVWCGGSQNGIAATAFLDKNKWKIQKHDSISSGIGQRAVAEDTNGTIVFGGDPNAKSSQKGGYVKLHKTANNLEVKRYHQKYPEFISFVFTEDNKFFVGALGGLMLVKENDFDKVGIERTVCNRVMLSDAGNLLIATKGKGVVKYDENAEEPFVSIDGTSSDVIYDIYAQNEHSIWAATNDGYSYYNGKSWINDIYPQEFDIEEETGKLSGKADNIWISKYPLRWSTRAFNDLKDTEFNETFFSVMYKRNKNAPETEITFYHKTVQSSGNTSFEWKGVDYMNHTPKDKILYSYRVNSQKWSAPSQKRNLNLLELSPGDYTFEVKAIDKDMNYDPTPAKVSFTVLRPVWQQAWFIIMIISFIAVIIYLITRIVMRNKKLASLNDSLVSANTEINKSKEEILQQNEEIMVINDALREQKEELEKSIQSSEMLSKFGQKLSRTLNMEAINRMMYDYVSSIIDISAYGIGVLDAKKNEIVYDEFFENDKIIKKVVKNLSLKNSLTAWCFNNQKNVIISNFNKEYLKYINEMPEAQTSVKPNSVIMFPLTVEEKRIGVLTINSSKKDAYTTGDINNLQTLASYIAIALDNAQAYNTINIQNKKITASINYALNIQKSILPDLSKLHNIYAHFIYFRPKDIVSGDFFWHAQLKVQNSVHPIQFLAVVDCTGHGVPGAFMSLISSIFLQQIVINQQIESPKEILEQLNERIVKALRQKETGNDDGMDVCLLKIEILENSTENKITYAGAKRPLYFIPTGANTLQTIKGSHKPIGGIVGKHLQYTETEINITRGSVLYLSSDGYMDQMNKERKRFTKRKFKDLITNIHTYPMQKQKDILDEQFNLHRQNEGQNDDITVLGIKL